MEKTNETRLLLFGAFCEALQMLWLGWTREEDALHLALRVEGIFLLQNVRTLRGEQDKQTNKQTRECYEGTASFCQNVSKNKTRIKKYKKYIFVKLTCKYPHLQELECWSYLLSRHGILLYVIYMQFIILWFIFILYLCLLKQVTVSGF